MPDIDNPTTDHDQLLGVEAGDHHARVQMAVVTFTRDIALASGTQAITGVGFIPEVVYIMEGINGQPAGGWGMSDATQDLLLSYIHNDVGDALGVSNILCVNHDVGAGARYHGTIQSMDVDGFTMDWTKFNAPTGTIRCMCICIG